MDEEITNAEEDRIAEQLAGMIGGNPLPEEKHSVHKFLHDVATSDDTTKLGFLSEEELGTARQTVRSYKELSLISEMIMMNPFFKEYFEKNSEIVTATSLSKDAKLLNLAVIQRREFADIPKKVMKENKGWFRKKNVEQS